MGCSETEEKTKRERVGAVDFASNKLKRMGRAVRRKQRETNFGCNNFSKTTSFSLNEREKKMRLKRRRSFVVFGV